MVKKKLWLGAPILGWKMDNCGYRHFPNRIKGSTKKIPTTQNEDTDNKHQFGTV